VKIEFSEKIAGGKNNIIICRNGLRFPKKSWAEWRDRNVTAVRLQLPQGFQTITEPVNVRLDYRAGDKRRRDMPAIVDAIFHVLEKCAIVSDDTLIWVTESSRVYDKENPGATITFL
jgi:Holliday junction resolvase RusA-like endonuclease